MFDEARAAGAKVVHHATNLGKGRALKTGFLHARALWPAHDVVCADCDGQHTPVDIVRVAAALGSSRDAMVLGARRFSGVVPTRSRFGNDMARRIFFLTTGVDLTDTQTGLRAYPHEMLGWLEEVPGERFEYELELLLRARAAGHAIIEVPIETVYIDDNAGSHFRPLHDSMRVLRPVLRFGLSSVVAAVLDAALLLVLHVLTGSLLLSVFGARGVSATVNYHANRRFVFGRGSQHSAWRYAGLVASLAVANWALMHAAVVWVGAPLLLAKLVVETVLFLVSYAVQRRVVFGRTTPTRQEEHVPA